MKINAKSTSIMILLALLVILFTISLSSVSAVETNITSGDNLGQTIENTPNGSIIHLNSGKYRNNVTNITIDKNIIIIGKNKKNTIIDAQNLGRIFNMHSNGTLTLINITLINGLSDNGSAIYNDGGKITLNNLDFINNTATTHFSSAGGVIYNTGDDMKIMNTNFINNTLNSYYGGLG
ncbi:hypothetical protein ALNOE001_11870 [Candidatus Methanobinarius endosymbioticus]|uniref:Right handed beta helix domain-containing protein n=1 Tax=Candidatus Methanobinarius endosymbioticus TaxID=2006182 RepID=A0A366MBV4_9EURY|nr:hypothetical protein ALNOE001_11870 [Candidatus Methanobinarius endosymbioticus]